MCNRLSAGMMSISVCMIERKGQVVPVSDESNKNGVNEKCDREG